MKLATIRTLDGRTRAVRVDDEQLVDLGAADLGEFLTAPGWEERAAAAMRAGVAGARRSLRPGRPAPPARSSASG